MLRPATIFFMLSVFGCATKPDGDAPQNFVPVPVVASVVRYQTHAQWDHFEDGTFVVYDSLTLQIESGPDLSTDKELLVVTVASGEIPADSPFRVPGTRMTFVLDEPIDGDVHLAWGTLNNPTVTNSRKFDT